MVVFSCRQVRALKMQRWAVVDQLTVTSVSVKLTSYKWISVSCILYMYAQTKETCNSLKHYSNSTCIKNAFHKIIETQKKKN